MAASSAVPAGTSMEAIIAMASASAQGATAPSLKGLKIIDADTHYSEPHDLWTKRAPAKLRERVPQVKVRDGVRSWYIDGDKLIGRGAEPQSAIRRDGSKAPGLTFMQHQIEDVHEGSWQVKARLEAMDQMNIWAQIVYPNLLGFGGHRAAKVDPQLRLACVQIYNDAMAELQAESGGRLFPMALLPWWDVKQAVAEVERGAAMGLRGVNINSDPHDHKDEAGRPLPDLGDPHWYPLWEACTERRLPVNFHVGTSEQSIDWRGNQSWPSTVKEMQGTLAGPLSFATNARVLGNLIYSGVLDRYPQLKFVSVESGIGWVRFFLEAIDYQYLECMDRDRLQRMPSEYFRTNFYACFWFERRSIANTIREIGVDNVLFETDFPHPTCLYPVSEATFALPGLTPEEHRKVLSENAARLYSIPLG